MPNLDYDPQNPTDLLDRPIAEGDYVAWGTTFGRSPAVAVCQIEEIRFLMKNPDYPVDSSKEFIPCQQHQAEKYQLRLLPIKSTGSVNMTGRYVPGGFPDPDTGKTIYFEKLDRPALKTIHLVKNVVKLESIS